ncbi:hypothetical protein GGR58DRAFT_502122 [Xylaria digitata]|nr:hypothetical protein GGR58DRAFT_502122 [Xylaria digitata]
MSPPQVKCISKACEDPECWREPRGDNGEGAYRKRMRLSSVETGRHLQAALLTLLSPFLRPLPTLSSPASNRAGQSATAKLTTHTSNKPSYDRNDLDEPYLIIAQDQRQQRSIPPKSPAPPSSLAAARSTPASHHRLRRTPNFVASPSPRAEEQHRLRSPSRVTVTLGPTGRYVLADEFAGRKQRAGRPKATRQLSQGNLSSSSIATSASFRRRAEDSNLEEARERNSNPVLRISKNTHNAILYALEATLRGPNIISIDPVECYSQMAELMSGRGPATSNGNGAPSVRATSGRSAVDSPSGIRSPKVIMQQRAEREARQKEERERLQREQDARAQEDAERRAAEKVNEVRRPTATATAAGAGSSTVGVDPSSARQSAQPISSRLNAESGGRTGRTSGIPTSIQAQVSQSTRNEQAPSRPPQGASGPSATGTTAGGPSGAQSRPGEYSTISAGRGRSSFPHAFERWETLSAHWEGLTSFWIRRLEQNASEIQGDPIAQQLSRQVTDLSSAGANLFHAVVELQRLRASSERKFQRWFFETRSELERNQEVAAMLEAALQEERRNRADAIRKAVEEEQGTSKLHKQLAEMRKELTISKEEARRAWEELGRREQEERDRTTSLQLGQPTIVGGVQVVPMTQGVSRGNTQREPRYAQPEMPQYTQSPTPRATRPEYTNAPAVQSVPASSSGPNPVFQTPSSVHHQQSYASEGTMSEEEFETPATQPSVYHAPVSVPPQPQYSATPDYSGSGYSATGWEELPGRQHHHHPTRLSDVLEEEEERSRTSASQLSRH